MDRDDVIRDDFPRSRGEDGFDSDSVEAHLTAVATHVEALGARVRALEVERDAIRQQLADVRAHEADSGGLDEPGPDRGGAARVPSGVNHDVTPVEATASVEVEPVEATEAVEAAAPDDGEVAARLFASKLAMEGNGRDTIVMRLAAEHEVEDPGRLVDDVLARLA